ncbi:hypothetical protein BWD42_00975 [Sphingobacterium sp. CZ-UAM]|uniref:DUF2480 family protein n=1 Tax=unclassified Sphingobacterium TaxID=2609468 RepID=UPI0009D06673|nr:DUF2480 family protein [Sphingobacterium sp. CZ-UAM]OOG18582.1 hypothetical protein BWD42_00975 [Sphingobacterium sp. CZ-UAM]
MFVNKVENSGILALDLIDFKPTVDIIDFDIKTLFFQEMIVKEKEFKAALAALELTPYKGKAVAFTCSADAIIPPWVYMALAEKFHAEVAYYDFKTVETLELELWTQNLTRADLSSYLGQKVVVRARPNMPESLYMLAAERLIPIVKSLMYGEIGMPKVIFKRA